MNRSVRLFLFISVSLVFLSLCLGVLTRLQLVRHTMPTPEDIVQWHSLVDLHLPSVKSGYGDVAFEDAKMAFYTQQAIFIDARPYEAYQRAHIPGAIFLYSKDYDVLKTKLTFSKDQLVIVYCSTQQCQMANKTADLLVKDGYRRVYVLTGGIKEWAANQGDLESHYVTF